MILYRGAVYRLASRSTHLQELQRYLTMSDENKGYDLDKWLDSEGWWDEEGLDYDEYSELGSAEMYRALREPVLNLEDPTAPSYLFLDFVEYRDDAELVHFTDPDAAARISEEGFVRGVPDHAMLGLTHRLGRSYFSDEGFAFAYPSDNIGARAGKWYGASKVIFRAPSLIVYSHQDEEVEAVFWTSDARDIQIFS